MPACAVREPPARRRAARSTSASCGGGGGGGRGGRPHQPPPAPTARAGVARRGAVDGAASVASRGAQGQVEEHCVSRDARPATLSHGSDAPSSTPVARSRPRRVTRSDTVTLCQGDTAE